jgi:hypothetical protein
MVGVHTKLRIRHLYKEPLLGACDSSTKECESTEEQESVCLALNELNSLRRRDEGLAPASRLG